MLFSLRLYIDRLQIPQFRRLRSNFLSVLIIYRGIGENIKIIIKKIQSLRSTIQKQTYFLPYFIII